MPVEPNVKGDYPARDDGRGEVTYQLRCSPGSIMEKMSIKLSRLLTGRSFSCRWSDGLSLRLVSPVPLKVDNGDASAEFTLKAGESAGIILESDANPTIAENS